MKKRVNIPYLATLIIFHLDSFLYLCCLGTLPALGTITQIESL